MKKREGMKEVSAWGSRLFWALVLKRAGVPILVVVPVLAFIGALLGWDTLGCYWKKTDRFALIIAGVNLVAVLALWFMQVRKEWVSQLSKFLTVILEKPEGAGTHVIMPYLPLTGEGDIRSQAQSVFTGWYGESRLPLENIVHEVKEQGVYVDESGRLNGGQPGVFYLVRIRLTEENKVTERIKNAVLVQPHARLAVKRRCTQPLVDSCKWHGAPQPLDLEQCEPFEKSGEQKTGCEKVWLVSRHEAAAEWLEQACKVTPEKVIQHLDDAELEALKKEKDVCVIGNLPMHRIKAVQEAGAQYVNLDLTVPPEWRGRELTLEEFEQCQPKLRRYQVLDLGEPQLPEEKAS